MELQWKANNDVIKELYWSENLSLEEIEQTSMECDQMRIWYPQNMDDNIYKRYGSALSYIELNGKWKGKAYSLIVDLEQSKEDIMSNFSETRRYETRRAIERDNLHTDFETPTNQKECRKFIDFYNRFANSKGLGRMIEEKTYALAQTGKLVVAKISTSDNEILSMHGYIVDRDSKKAALYTSSSLFREKKDIANMIGRANGLLHYQSMLHFKEKEYLFYDFGGAYMGEDNMSLQNITRYKMSFGGQLIEFDNGIIIPFRLIREVDNFLAVNINFLRSQKVIIWGAAQYGEYLIYQMNQFGINVYEIIDNGLADNNKKYVKDSILEQYEPKDTIVIVTTNRESYMKIKEQENCQNFVKKNKLVGLRR